MTPHVIDTQKIPSMPFSGVQGIGKNFNGIQGINCNTFPFERYFAVLKKYIRNRARPEGSIAKGYITEEVIEFCVDYMEELCPIGIPVSRQEGG